MRLFSTASAHFDLDQVAISIPSNESNGRIYLTWQPIKATAKLVFPASADREVILRNAGKTGELVFGMTRATTDKKELTLTLPKTATAPTEFWIAGEEASVEDGDAVVEVVAKKGGTVLATIPMMVRIRKDASKLTVRERNRFIWAMAQLNAKGTGDFKIFRQIHSQDMLNQAHGVPAFLPWHRAYMLDLERALQAINPSVALPYWRFDNPAGALFTEDFLGKPSTVDAAGKIAVAKFATSNPLEFWKTDSQTGIERAPMRNWDPSSSAPPTQVTTMFGPSPWVITQASTLGLGATYQQFQPSMEDAPHGSAHVSWRGYLQNPATAPKDPLFFLIHANVDRLWAKWQKQNPTTLMKKSAPEAYYAPASAPDGQKLGDTMWPWNKVTGGDYPPFLAGGELHSSPITDQPPSQPTIEDMIDYQGAHSVLLQGTYSHQGFDYDDVKYR